MGFGSFHYELPIFAHLSNFRLCLKVIYLLLPQRPEVPKERSIARLLLNSILTIPRLRLILLGRWFLCLCAQCHCNKFSISGATRLLSCLAGILPSSVVACLGRDQPSWALLASDISAFCIFHVFSCSSSPLLCSIHCLGTQSQHLTLHVYCYFPLTLNTISLHGNDNKVIQAGRGSLKWIRCNYQEESAATKILASWI